MEGLMPAGRPGREAHDRLSVQMLHRCQINPDLWTIGPALLVVAALVLASCGGDSPTEPSPPSSPTTSSPTVAAIAPNTGTTLGGTEVTISGTNFASGATVTIGGAPATNVAVQNPTSLAARTPQHAAGTADVRVTVGAQSAMLPGAFTYVAPSVAPNAPPTISSITARGTRPGMPRQFADVDEVINVVALVQDGETPLPNLRYEWTVEAGEVIGSGPAIQWRAPRGISTPADTRLTLIVTETYETTNDAGLPVSEENRASATTSVRVHDSVREIGDMAVTFLTEFSQQHLSPEQIVRNFTDSCRGKRQEIDDIRKNQAEFTVTRFTLGPPSVHVTFGGVCPFRDRFGDACTNVSARWESTVKATGRSQVSVGNDQVTSLYEGGRWWLCESDFDGTTSSGLMFKR
jgi:IPT/TIG domain